MTHPHDMQQDLLRIKIQFYVRAYPLFSADIASVIQQKVSITPQCRVRKCQTLVASFSTNAVP